MKIYTDKQLTQEIVDNILDLGILFAGKTKQYKFWVFNDSKAFLQDLEFIANHREVKVIHAPITLDAHMSDELILEWTPSVTLKEGLKTILHVKGIELWG